MLRNVVWGLLCLLVGIAIGRSPWTGDGPSGDQPPATATSASASPAEPPVEFPQTEPAESDPVVLLHDQRDVSPDEAPAAAATEPTSAAAVDVSAPMHPPATTELPAAEPENNEDSVADVAEDPPLPEQTLVSAPTTLPANDVPVLHPRQCAAELPSLGTALQWAESPEAAARLARQQEKLVFLIHVSGNFKIPEFT